MINTRFLLDSLSRLTIGNGTVYNFVDYIGETHVTGGILNYTRNFRFLEDNLFNNFNGGVEGRYGYGRGKNLHSDNLDSKLYYVFDHDGNAVEKSGLVQDRIGEFYQVPFTRGNSDMNTLSEAAFLKLNEEIRNQNLNNNINSSIFRNRYSTSNPDAFLAKGVSFPVEIGEDGVDNRFRREYQGYMLSRKPLKENTLYLEQSKKINKDLFNSNNLDKNFYENFRTEHYDDFSTKLKKPNKKLKRLEESANSVRENLFKFRIINNVIQGRFGSNFQTSEIDSYEIPNLKNEPIINRSENNDIISFNKPNIEKNTIRDFGKINGYWSREYGITTINDIVIYSIYDTNDLPKHANISVSDGILIKNTDGNNKTYTYFNELDGNTETDIKEKNVYKNFTPQLIKDETNYSGLLRKTNELFRNNEIKSLVNRFHTESLINPNDFETSYSSYGMSRGRNLLKAGGYTDKSSGYDNPYCRVWTAHHQYATLKDRIRPFVDGDNFVDIGEIQKNNNIQRPYGAPEHFASNTVLQNNGYVKISPDKTFNINNGKNIDHYMFSLENLAWKGYTSSLSPLQIGPNGGRIMWFPPYNLKFTENINVQWNENSFIGRGEKIYTYTNTERGGTLNFTLLMDHPSILNSWSIKGEKNSSNNANNENEDAILRFFAGCSQLEISDTDIQEDNQNETANTESDTIKTNDELSRYGFVVFFPNDYSGVDKDTEELAKILDCYESPNSSITIGVRDEAFSDEILLPTNVHNKNLFKLNTKDGFSDQEIFQKISSELMLDSEITWFSYEEMKTKLCDLFSGNTGDSVQYVIEGISSYGNASSHGTTSNNNILANRRRKIMCNLAHYFCDSIDVGKIEMASANIINVNDVNQNQPDINTLEAKIARSAILIVSRKLSTTANIPNEQVSNGTAVTGDILTQDDITNNTTNNIISIVNSEIEETTKKEGTESDEYKYFSQLQSYDNIAYSKIVDKIRYFTPLFHTMTPEGFNERLNFLHQCTRQGPTDGAVTSNNNSKSTNTLRRAANLAFGRAPYCVLRIGDFFHTKICIQSISYDFDNGGGVQWDLNPEGAGVQPMMANVSMNFIFVGGQDIGGVVNELQNAVSENYYANSSLYNNRAKKSY